MKTSRRAERMERHHKRRSHVGLSLVSLMDIFTILVFFLLVNSSDVEVLPNAKSVTLPESIAEQKPRENVVVLVTADQILVQGEPVADARTALNDRSPVIDGLRAALRRQNARVLLRGTDGREHREVTIMGDKQIPYRLLKKVMVTCTQADYDRISLAVLQKTAEEG